MNDPDVVDVEFAPLFAFNIPDTPNVPLINPDPETSSATDGFDFPIPTFPLIINPFIGIFARFEPIYPIDILSA